MRRCQASKSVAHPVLGAACSIISSKKNWDSGMPRENPEMLDGRSKLVCTCMMMISAFYFPRSFPHMSHVVCLRLLRFGSVVL